MYEKNIWMKNINFSWRKSIFKIWDRKILENFPDKKSKIWNFHFLNWLSEEKCFEKKIGRKIFFDRFFSRKCFLRKVNLKNENFKFSIFCPKKIPNFFDLKFWKWISSWKINIFYPDFFSWQGMIILHRKTTPALSLFDL